MATFVTHLWYDRIGDDPLFISEVKLVLGQFTVDLAHRLSRMDVAHLVFGPVLQAAASHCVAYRRAVEQLEQNRMPIPEGCSRERVIDTLSLLQFPGGGHFASQSARAERAYLRHVSGLILSLSLTISMSKSRTFMALVRELFVAYIWQPVLDAAQDPYNLHRYARIQSAVVLLMSCSPRSGCGRLMRPTRALCAAQRAL